MTNYALEFMLAGLTIVVFGIVMFYFSEKSLTLTRLGVIFIALGSVIVLTFVVTGIPGLL